MSTSSNTSRLLHRRFESLQKRELPRRKLSTADKILVSRYDAYSFALRAAYLCHLLQPKLKRLQHVANQSRPQQHKPSTSVTDLVKDFSPVRDSKSTRFPQGFIADLEKRITGVMMGTEKMPEFSDPLVKRNFAIFLNELKKPEFRKQVDQDRRVEGLLLKFFSTTTKDLQAGKPPTDDSWKLMVDRYVALFVRLISSTLKSNNWARDRPELASRLQTLESKLLVHDQDLVADSQRAGGAGGSTVEVEIPRSQHVKDMPLVLTVANIFGKQASQVQGDLDAQKDLWTEKTALRDLKAYQTNLSLNSRKALRAEDFDTHEAFERWRKSEVSDLSQMLMAILQSNKDLAKSSSQDIPQLKHLNGTNVELSSTHVRRPSDSTTESPTSYVLDAPVDIGQLNMNSDSAPTTPIDNNDDEESYMFIPPEPRAYYKAVLKEALLHDLKETTNNGESASVHLLSKKSTELLNELSLRWRIPPISRLILLLDVVRERFVDREVDLEVLDAAFSYIKDPPLDDKKIEMSRLQDHSTWPLADQVLYQRVLTLVHDCLMRDLFEQFQECYATAFPNIGPNMTVLETHVWDDPHFAKKPEEMSRFTLQLNEVLEKKAQNAYNEIFEATITDAGQDIQFYHIIQLKKGVIKLFERIAKRFRKNPEIMGVKPYPLLVKSVLPHFASDASEQTHFSMEEANSRGEEIPLQDGFDLYEEMVEMRRMQAENLPDVPFEFQIEDTLAPFVWRWIAMMDEKVISWVDASAKSDSFQPRVDDPNQIPTDEERHSDSVIDLIRSFKQAIDPIEKLQWADKLQRAKFMTGLSKCLCSGVTKYCDMVEQFFIREMDRLLPEQEAALQQSRQEKFFQMAKDALYSKEKIEPFQFLPESFVKLNNVGWAMQQLDNMEREINAEACADIIQRAEPPNVRKQRKNEKFVFTVKIIEAEDLRACDANGLSDPYVVLGDEYQKRISKTRIIYGNLNPRWEETVDITTTGPINLIATIWDWDMMGDHDCVGRTFLKLDPSHFRDFLPREYWLDLDTQGRLLVRVSMEGEKDDIRFYFGKSFRTLKRTERDMTRKITDKLSAYISHCLSRRTLKNLTSKGLTMSSLSSYIAQRRITKTAPTKASPAEVEEALKPLFAYFNDNFAIMEKTLTSPAMITVMTRLWKETLSTIELLLVPPLSDKPSNQTQLAEPELDVAFQWLQLLFDFFHAVDEQTGQAEGVPADVLKSAKYHDLKNLHFFYYEPTENLIRTSENMASASANRQRQAQNLAQSLAAPMPMSMPLAAGSGAGGSGGLALPTTRRAKSIMVRRNLGTIKKAKEEKRKEAQAEASDDMILRILRMRPEAHKYLRERSKQKERMAAVAAAEMIVRQTLNAGGGIMRAR